MMRAIVQTASRHLVQSWRQGLAMLVMFSVSTMLALVTSGYRTSLDRIFSAAGKEYWVVQEFNKVGELGGSRIPPEVESLLVARGVSEIIPEIHTSVGTSRDQIVQLRGISPAAYLRTVTFDLLDGQSIDPQTPPRQAMLGWRLAERWKVNPGSTVQLRGRDFTVLGIFQTGAYADNEAWISNSDAQALLGWGEDVSIYLISTDGRLQPGDSLEEAQPVLVEVVQRGKSVEALTAPIFAFLWLVTKVAFVSCGLTLAVVLLRLALMHQRDLAILYCLGFPPAVPALYLLVQAATIAMGGILLGGGGALLVGEFANLQAAGYAVPLLWDVRVLAQNAISLVLITLGGAALPALWLNRLEPDQVLRGE